MPSNDPFQIPAEMRALAERSIDQTRQAFEGFISAAQNAVNAFGGQAETARKSAKDATEKAMSFAEQNIKNSLELAEQMVRAKDMQEVMKLQTDFIRRQMQVLTDQARELGESALQHTKTRSRT
jgi:phasin